MDLTKVLGNFLLISGINQNKSSVYMPIIKDSIKKLTSKLKNKTIKEEDKPRLNYAAATFAFYKYMIFIKAKNNTESFTAGNVTIKVNIDAKLNAAKDIWLSEKEEILDLLRDDEFSFKSI